MMQADGASSSSGFGRTVCVVTGASRGFGRTVARDVSPLLGPGSVLLLAARSGADLRSLQEELVGITAGGGGGEEGGLCVECVAADLGLQDGVDSVVSAVRQHAGAQFDQLLLVNNAASLGDVSRYARSFTDMKDVDSYLSLNISSALCLTAAVLQAFPKRAGLKRTVVNISSLAAVKPIPSWVLYCGGKAARDMMFKVLAEEEPDIRVLNYAPGPLETSMLAEARSNTADASMKQSLLDMHSQGQVLTCETSCSKLLQVLLRDEFTNGVHLDFYDI